RDLRDFGICHVRKIEISLLVAHEAKVERVGLRLMSGIRACNGKPASQGWLIAGIGRTQRIGDESIATPSALHHEIAIPCIVCRQSQRKTDSEFFAANSLTPMDNAIDAAMHRERSNDARIWN